MGGLHILDLIVVVAIALLIVGPKTVQSLSRKAGKGVGQAKTVKDQLMSELPMEEISEIIKYVFENSSESSTGCAEAFATRAGK